MTQNKSIIKLDYDVSPHLLRSGNSSVHQSEWLPKYAIAKLEYQIWLNKQIKELLCPIQVDLKRAHTDTLDLSRNTISEELIEAVAKFYVCNS